MIRNFPQKLIYVDEYKHLRLTGFTRNGSYCKYCRDISGYRTLFL